MTPQEAIQQMAAHGGMLDFVDVSGVAFKGTVVRADFAAFNHYGKTPTKDNRATGLFMRAWIQPDPDTDERVKEIVAKLMPLVCTAGTTCRPSRDETPKGPSYSKIPIDMTTGNDEDQTGPFFTGGRIPASSNFQFFFSQAVQAGFDLDRVNPDGNIEKTLLGVRANWITIDQPSRDIKKEDGAFRFKRDETTKDEGGEKRKPTLLVMDGDIEYDVDISSMSGTTSTSQAIDDSVATDLVVKLLDGGTKSKGDIVNAVVSSTASDEALQSFVLGRMTPDWLASQSEWNYKNDVLTAV